MLRLYRHINLLHRHSLPFYLKEMCEESAKPAFHQAYFLLNRDEPDKDRLIKFHAQWIEYAQGILELGYTKPSTYKKGQHMLVDLNL